MNGYYSNSLNNQYQYNKICKLLAIFGFFCIFISLMIIYYTPHFSGYEFSLYDSYPKILWDFALASLLSGQILLFISALKFKRKTRYWIFGILIIFLSSFILICLPLIRGYYINGSGDVLTHIGYIRDIILFSNFGSNIYPLDHIYCAIIYLFTKLSIEKISFLIPIYFSIFYFMTWTVLAKEIFKEETEFFFLLIFCLSPCFGNYFIATAPNHQIFLYIPFFIFLISRILYSNSRKKYIIITIIPIILLSLFHPLVSLLIILVLIGFSVNINQNRGLIHNLNTFTLFLSLVIIAFFSWNSYILMTINTIKPIIQTITGTIEISSKYTEGLSYLDLESNFYIIIKHIFFTYGIFVLFLSLFIISFFWYYIIKKKKLTTNIASIRFINILSIYSFLFFILGTIIFFINNSIGFGRIYYFAMLFSFFLISIFFANIINNKTNYQIYRILLILLIISSLSYLSIFTLHLSPLTRNLNQQVPETDYKGMETFLNFRDESLKFFELGLSCSRFNDAIFGLSNLNKRIPYYEKNPLPKHFGMQKNMDFCQQYPDPKYYFITNSLGKHYQEQIFPEFQKNWSFTNQEFKMFLRENYLTRIYSNRELDIYLFNPSLRCG